MLKQIIQAAFYAIYTLFLIRFLLMMGEGSHFFIYTDYQAVIAWVYAISDGFAYPVETVIMLIYNNIPFIQTPFFPLTSFKDIGVILHATLVQLQQAVPILPAMVVTASEGLTRLPGYIEWLSLFNFVFYALLQPASETLFVWLENLMWVFITERVYQKEKDTKFRNALRQGQSMLSEKERQLEKELEEKKQLQHSVVTDELTRVFNKRFFLDKIQDEFKLAKKQKSQLGIIMVDIDHFKKLNDTYGHLMGDKVLQRVAQAAKLATPGRAYCCRFGGEEFSIIIPGKSFDDVQQVANEIHRQLPLLTFEEDKNLKVTCSQGICYGDFSQQTAQGLDNPDALIKLADDELYKAKLGGRNRVCAVKLTS
jgi:diguanylate cyclase (GGDEF)-like protein